MDALEIFTEFWGILPDGSLKWLLLSWIALTAFIAYSLKSPGKGRERFLKIIKKQNLQNYYRSKLKQLLNYTAKHFFKDHKLIKVRRKNGTKKFNTHAGYFNTYTESSYAFLLRLALIYPLFFLLISWFITSYGGEIGSFKVLNNAVPFFQRFLLIGGIGLYVFLLRVGERTTGFKSLIYYAVAGAVAITVFFADSGSDIIVGTVLVTLAAGVSAGAVVAFAGTTTVVVTFESVAAFFFAGAIAGIVEYLCDKTQGKAKYSPLYWLSFFTFFVLFLLGIVYWLGTQQEVRKENLSAIIFLGLLPLVNSPFDWV